MAHDDTPPTPLLQLLLDALRWSEEEWEHTLALRGVPTLTPARAQLLAQVDEGGTGPSELARRLGISRQAAHKRVDELIEIGLLRVDTDPDNRSAQRAMLTPQGSVARSEAQRAHGALEAELARRLGRIRVRALRATLEAEWGEAGG
jgi:DNA-binding MarR family transcriptional regulator